MFQKSVSLSLLEFLWQFGQADIFKRRICFCNSRCLSVGSSVEGLFISCWHIFKLYSFKFGFILTSTSKIWYICYNKSYLCYIVEWFFCFRYIAVFISCAFSLSFLLFFLPVLFVCVCVPVCLFICVCISLFVFLSLIYGQVVLVFDMAAVSLNLLVRPSVFP